jgi:predicted RecA/RadA family phage recombinase
MYNKQEWKDEIPDLTRPILDSNGKQKTDPQTGRPLFELVQEGTRITSTRLNTMEGGIENAHTLIEHLAKEIGGNFVATINGVMGLSCTAQGLKATWTAGVAYVGGRRYEVSSGEMALNPTQGQYLYVDVDGAVKKTTSEATAKTGLLLFYVATDTSAVISSKDRRQNINLEELIKRVESVEIPEDLINQVQQIPRDYVRYPAFATTQGTPAAYTVTLNPAPLASPGLPEGMGITIVPHRINTANPTLKINDFSAMPLRNVNGQALKSSELKAGIPQMFRYMNGAFVAVSPVETAEALKFAASNGMTSTNVQDAIIEAFQSGSEFKSKLAEVITAKGQPTSAIDSLSTFITNIESIGLGITWISRTSATDNAWMSVTYGNGMFVAVANTGTGNRVMTSPNGITWTSRTSAADNDWASVTYGNGMFVAVASSGTGNRVMTSPNGITWTSRTSAADNAWRCVTYGNGMFVAVASSGTGNRVMTSLDGITWTSRTSAADNDWMSVTYGNGMFVAVANTGTGNRVMTSPNGITWTSRTSAADNSWMGVTYGNGMFVAVASSGTGNRVMTSLDGITWTSRTSAADNSWGCVTYGNGMFVAVAYVGTGNRVMTSPNGITWTSRTSAYSNTWRCVTYGNGMFVAVAFAGDGNRVMTSSPI